MLLEDVGQLVFWLVVLVMSLNLVFLFFLLGRRGIRKRFFALKDAARERYRDTIGACALGQLGPEQAAVALVDAKSAAEHEAVAEMVFAASSPATIERLSELLFILGLVGEWARVAFGRRASKTFLGIFRGRQVKEQLLRWPKPVRPLYRMQFSAVPRALAVNNLGHLSPKHVHHFLTIALRDPSSQVRRVAIEGLGRSRKREAIPLLVEELRKAVEEGNDLSLRTLKVALICFGLEDLESFLPYLTNPNRRCRFFVTDTIRQICDRAAMTHRLTKTDFSPALYRAVLEQCQYDEFEDVRARSCHIARYFRDQNATDMLRRLMADKNEFVRLHSVRACADRSYEDLIPEVVIRLTDERWLVRESAVQTLRAMGSKGREALMSFFVDCADKFAAEQACDEFQRQGVLSELLAAMAAGGEGGLMAQRACHKMASMGKTSMLLSQLRRSDSFALQCALIDTLAYHPTDEFVSLLRVLSHPDSGQINEKAKETLGRIERSGITRIGSVSGSRGNEVSGA